MPKIKIHLIPFYTLSLFLSQAGEANDMNSWETNGKCYFDGKEKTCHVRTTIIPDARIHAWGATYWVTWNDGMQHVIEVGSDVRASVQERGTKVNAEQLPEDADQFCKIKTSTGHTIKFNSGRLDHVKDRGGC